jgi:hypothetical protein
MYYYSTYQYDGFDSDVGKVEAEAEATFLLQGDEHIC